MGVIPIKKIIARSEESSFSKDFKIDNLSYLSGGKDIVQSLHRHDFFFILVLKKGSGEHVIDFISYPVKDYSIFFLRPGQVHQLALKRGSTGYLIEFNAGFISLHDKVARQVIRKAGSKNYFPFDSSRFRKIFPVVESVFQEYCETKEGYLEVIKANLIIFFIELIRQSSESTSNDVNLYSQERLEEFLDLLDKHITKHKQVSHYADLMNLSLYQLNAIIKTTLGKTSSELINEYLVLESKRYLLATSDKVNQIANHLGYEDVSYFIRFFKKHTGHSPEAFRQNFR